MNSNTGGSKHGEQTDCVDSLKRRPGSGIEPEISMTQLGANGLSEWHSGNMECLSPLLSQAWFPGRSIPHVIERAKYWFSQETLVSSYITLEITHYCLVNMSYQGCQGGLSWFDSGLTYLGTLVSSYITLEITQYCLVNMSYQGCQGGLSWFDSGLTSLGTLVSSYITL
jgi:hypothetical protein